MTTLHDLLRSFEAGPDRSKAAAQDIESEILRNNLEETPEFESLVDIIASYQPGGGEYLYNEQDLVDACREVLRAWK